MRYVQDCVEQSWMDEEEEEEDHDDVPSKEGGDSTSRAETSNDGGEKELPNLKRPQDTVAVQENHELLTCDDSKQPLCKRMRCEKA